MSDLPTDWSCPVLWPVIQTFKRDSRSHVWLAQAPDGSRHVVKRFTFNRFKQWFLSAILLHPADHERWTHRRMAALGIPTVPVTGIGYHGGKRYTVTPAMGVSLDRWLSQGTAGVTTPVRRQVAAELGRMIGLMLRHRLFFRDMKVSNLVMDDEHRVRLIDAGFTRQVPRGRVMVYAQRMLSLLEKTTRDACLSAPTGRQPGITRGDRLRFVRALVEVWPEGRGLAGVTPQATGLSAHRRQDRVIPGRKA